VEKKPLFHFLPGTAIFSIATVGCNLHCKNCQNWEISQQNPGDSEAYPMPPEKVVALAREAGCPSIAYTYTDPVVYYEYALDSSRRAREAGLRNALVTAAYINHDPWVELCRSVDAATVDLKSISDQFYRDVCDATLKPVQDALVTAKAEGIWLEVSNLVIPTLNDTDVDFTALCRWHRENLGTDTPLHFLRFYPQYKMEHLPPTPNETLERARDAALAEGIHFVYVGNILSEEGENTYCPNCKALLVARRRHAVIENRLASGACPKCKAKVSGVWT